MKKNAERFGGWLLAERRGEKRPLASLGITILERMPT